MPSVSQLDQNNNKKLVRPREDGGKNKKEILFENYYYDVTEWVKKHPGGRVIEFYTEAGEDATIAIQQFHFRQTSKVAAILKSLPRRPAHDAEIGLDPVTRKRHQALTKDFTELHRQLEVEGYFKPSPWHVTYRIVELIVMALAGYFIIQGSESVGSYCVGLLVISLFFGRCGFLVHETGHKAFTGNAKIDKIIESFVFGVGDGMSASWWSRSHNMHHAMPQRMERDVDLDTLPLLAFNAKVAKDPKQGRNFMVRHQSLFFLTIDTMLVGFLWKFYVHPRYAILKRKWLEIGAMLLHYWLVYHFLGVWTFFFGMWLGPTYMFGTFSLSHTHLPVTTKALHWVEYGFVHTMDVEPSWWCDWFMGWLNYQIEHHLFPAIPHFRLYGIRQRVQALARKHNIPYQSLSYSDAVRKTLDNLTQVSKHLQG